MNAGSAMNVVVSETPIDSADVYHYHRPQMESALASPSVVTVHHDLDDPDPFVTYDKFHARYGEATHVVCLNTLQQAILAGKGIEHTSVIPHGYDAALFSKKLRRSFDATRNTAFGIVSKRYPRRFKGEAHLYDILHFLPTDSVRFVLIGEGRSQDALHMESLGFEVECHEVMPYRVFPKAYEAIDFLLMISTFEGGPASLPEAVASGTPVICTRTGMVPDMIEDGCNGIVLTGRAREDAARMVSVLRNEGNAWNRLMIGAETARSAPSWEQVIDAHARLYRSIVQRAT
jgi:glycosyltransferase involved in cell wall biosynthesis